jgi:hypothetical protein
MTTTNTMPASVIVTATLEERVAQLEAQIKALLEKQPKVHTTTAKVLSADEAEAKRLKINEASRISKQKSRAAALGMTVEAYQKYQADKKLKPVPTVSTIALEGPVTEIGETEETVAAEEPTAEPVAEQVVEEQNVEEKPKGKGGKK